MEINVKTMKRWYLRNLNVSDIPKSQVQRFIVNRTMLLLLTRNSNKNYLMHTWTGFFRFFKVLFHLVLPFQQTELKSINNGCIETANI